jgi:hypothetical protein
MSLDVRFRLGAVRHLGQREDGVRRYLTLADEHGNGVLLTEGDRLTVTITLVSGDGAGPLQWKRRQQERIRVLQLRPRSLGSRIVGTLVTKPILGVRSLCLRPTLGPSRPRGMLRLQVPHFRVAQSFGQSVCVLPRRQALQKEGCGWIITYGTTSVSRPRCP